MADSNPLVPGPAAADGPTLFVQKEFSSVGDSVTSFGIRIWLYARAIQRLNASPQGFIIHERRSSIADMLFFQMNGGRRAMPHTLTRARINDSRGCRSFDS